jgi:hypothetical protein
MHPLMRSLAAALACLAAAVPLSAQIQGKPLEPANLDTTCSPCQDFYRYGQTAGGSSGIPSLEISRGGGASMSCRNRTMPHSEAF